MSYYNGNIVWNPSYAWKAACQGIPPQWRDHYVVLGFQPEALYVSKSELKKHAYIVGGTGCGKTSRLVAPLLAQLIQAGDLVWSIDCKLDEMLLGHLRGEATAARRRLRVFSMQPGIPSDFSLDLLGALSLVPRSPKNVAEILLGSLGLDRARETYFIGQNLGALTEALTRASRKTLTFIEIARELKRVIEREKGRYEHAVQALDALESLADVPELNPGQGPAISVAELLQSGHPCHFLMPVTSGSKSCAIAASLLLKMVALASRDLRLSGHAPRRLYLAMDEFQDVAGAGDLADLLGQVRGIGGGVSLILLHQAEKQLDNEALIALLQTSGVQVYFSPRSKAAELQQWSGEKLEYVRGHGTSWSAEGTTYNESYSPIYRSALDLNTIQEVNRLDGFGFAVVANGEPRPTFFPHHVDHEVALRREQGAFSDQATKQAAPPRQRIRQTAPTQRTPAKAPGHAGPKRAANSLAPRKQAAPLRQRIEELLVELRKTTLVARPRA